MSFVVMAHPPADHGLAYAVAILLLTLLLIAIGLMDMDAR